MTTEPDKLCGTGAVCLLTWQSRSIFCTEITLSGFCKVFSLSSCASIQLFKICILFSFSVTLSKSCSKRCIYKLMNKKIKISYFKLCALKCKCHDYDSLNRIILLLFRFLIFCKIRSPNNFWNRFISPEKIFFKGGF